MQGLNPNGFVQKEYPDLMGWGLVHSPLETVGPSLQRAHDDGAWLSLFVWWRIGVLFVIFFLYVQDSLLHCTHTS